MTDTEPDDFESAEEFDSAGSSSETETSSPRSKQSHPSSNNESQPEKDLVKTKSVSDCKPDSVAPVLDSAGQSVQDAQSRADNSNESAASSPTIKHGQSGSKEEDQPGKDLDQVSSVANSKHDSVVSVLDSAGQSDQVDQKGADNSSETTASSPRIKHSQTSSSDEDQPGKDLGPARSTDDSKHDSMAPVLDSAGPSVQDVQDQICESSETDSGYIGIKDNRASSIDDHRSRQDLAQARNVADNDSNIAAASSDSVDEVAMDGQDRRDSGREEESKGVKDSPVDSDVSGRSADEETDGCIILPQVENSKTEKDPGVGRGDRNSLVQPSSATFIDKRIGTLESIDQSKKELLEKGSAGAAVFERLVKPDNAQVGSGGSGWRGGWSSMWQAATQAVYSVSDAAASAALGLLEDNDGEKQRGTTGNDDSNVSAINQPRTADSQKDGQVASEEGGGVASRLVANLRTGLTITTDTASRLKGNVTGLGLENVLEHSLGALEALGKKTLTVITERPPDSLASRDRLSACQEGNDAAQPSTDIRTDEDVTFAGSFEHYKGTQAMQQLEAMARESSQALHTQLATLSVLRRREEDALASERAALLEGAGEDQADTDGLPLAELSQPLDLDSTARQALAELIGPVSQRISEESDWLANAMSEMQGGDNENDAESDDGWEEALVIPLKQRLELEPEAVLAEMFRRGADSLAFVSAKSTVGIAALAGSVLAGHQQLALETVLSSVVAMAAWHRAVEHGLSGAYVEAVRMVHEQALPTATDDKARGELDQLAHGYVTELFLNESAAASHLRSALELFNPVLRLALFGTNQ